jgi:hypothetical protein
MNPFGRPREYTPEQLEEKIVEYFKFIEDENKQRTLRRFEGVKAKPYTISGICVFLDIHMDTWCAYAKLPEYEDSIKRAKMRVMNYVEEGSLTGALNTIGAIFNLKNNFGWADKIEINNQTDKEKLTAEDINAALELAKKQHAMHKDKVNKEDVLT